MVLKDKLYNQDKTLRAWSRKQTRKKGNEGTRILREIIFDLCLICNNNYHNPNGMSIPPGAFSAKKIRQNEEKLVLARITNGDGFNSQKYFNNKSMELSPLKYNSKLMNSIWGLYNRYSPHNIKRTNDDLFNFNGGLKETSSLSKAAASKETANNVGKTSGKSQNLPKIENFWPNIPISQSH